jgi:hypothetical protein
VPRREGREVAAFGARLERRFPGWVSWGGEVAVPGSRRGLALDFHLEHPATGLRVDIEIDEPYTAWRREPAHCIGWDDERDAFLVSNGWVVVRFAEEQVVRWPEACCRVVARAVFELTGDAGPLERLAAAEDPPPVPRWDEAGARAMAAGNARRHYVPNGVFPTVELEAARAGARPRAG